MQTTIKDQILRSPQQGVTDKGEVSRKRASENKPSTQHLPLKQEHRWQLCLLITHQQRRPLRTGERHGLFTGGRTYYKPPPWYFTSSEQELAHKTHLILEPHSFCCPSGKCVFLLK